MVVRKKTDVVNIGMAFSGFDSLADTADAPTLMKLICEIDRPSINCAGRRFESCPRHHMPGVAQRRERHKRAETLDARPHS